MKGYSYCLCLLVTGVFLLAFGTASSNAYNFLYDTPTGNTWQGMEKNIQDLKNQLPADGGPRSSVEGQRRVNVMYRIVDVYGRGITLFRSATPVTKILEEEKRWYDYMAHSCGIHAQNWTSNAHDMERITENLRLAGK